jgi:hypothetical protein
VTCCRSGCGRRIGLHRLVILAESGHVERSFGNLDRTSKRTGGKVLTIDIQSGGEQDSIHRHLLTGLLVIVR